MGNNACLRVWFSLLVVTTFYCNFLYNTEAWKQIGGKKDTHTHTGMCLCMYMCVCMNVPTQAGTLTLSPDSAKIFTSESLEMLNTARLGESLSFNIEIRCSSTNFATYKVCLLNRQSPYLESWNSNGI